MAGDYYYIAKERDIAQYSISNNNDVNSFSETNSTDTPRARDITATPDGSTVFFAFVISGGYNEDDSFYIHKYDPVTGNRSYGYYDALDSTGASIKYEPNEEVIYANIPDDFDDTKFVKIDPNSFDVTKELETSYDAGAMDLDSTGAYLIHEESSGIIVTKYDLDGNEVWSTSDNFDVSGMGYKSIAANGSVVAVPTTSNSIKFLDVETGSLDKEVDYDTNWTRSYPYYVEIDSNNNVLLGLPDVDAYTGSTIAMYNYSDGSKQFEVDTGENQIKGVFFGKNEETAYISDFDSTKQFDLDGNELYSGGMQPEVVSYPTLEAGPTIEKVSATKTTTSATPSTPSTVFAEKVSATRASVSSTVLPTSIVITQPAVRFGVTSTVATADSAISLKYPAQRITVESDATPASLSSFGVEAEHISSVTTVTSAQLAALFLQAARFDVEARPRNATVPGYVPAGSTIIRVNGTVLTPETENRVVSSGEGYVVVGTTTTTPAMNTYIRLGYGETTKTYPNDYTT